MKGIADMPDVILIIVLAAIIGGAIMYIVKAKKKGVKCIGCPSGGTCSGKCSGCSPENHVDKTDTQ